MEQEKIATYVFLDLESTGLGGSGKQPRIVELSMVAVHRDNLQDPCIEDTPRVLNKLTLCTYPMKVIEQGAAQITGLYNDNLFYQKDFDDGMCTLLNSFLQRQAAPVCLIAHNGHHFDFPLLRSELQRLGKELPAGILCADSLEVFKSLDQTNDRMNDDRASPKSTGSHSPSERGDGKKGSPKTNGLPVPVFYNEQQLSNNTTPEDRLLLESWRKEPPPAPCPKRNSSRVFVEPEKKEILSIRKKLFEEQQKDIADKSGTPPQNKNPDTPVSAAVKRRLEDGTDHKVKKRLFGDLGEDPKSLINTEKNISACEIDKTTSEIPSNEPKDEETQLYWTGDLEECATQIPGENIHWESNEDEVSDDILMTSVLEMEEDETQKSLLEEEMRAESTNWLTDNLEVDSSFINKAVASTSGTSHKSCNILPKKQTQSYKLADLHLRVLGYEMCNAHNAESDCLALLRIFHRAFGRVSTWIDDNAIEFSHVMPMYNVKIKSNACLAPNVFPYQLE